MIDEDRLSNLIPAVERKYNVEEKRFIIIIITSIINKMIMIIAVIVTITVIGNFNRQRRFAFSSVDCLFVCYHNISNYRVGCDAVDVARHTMQINKAVQ